MIAAENLGAALESGAQPFESLHDLMLYSAHNALRFYTWGETTACLPAGATRRLAERRFRQPAAAARR